MKKPTASGIAYHTVGTLCISPLPSRSEVVHMLFRDLRESERLEFLVNLRRVMAWNFVNLYGDLFDPSSHFDRNTSEDVVLRTFAVHLQVVADSYVLLPHNRL